MNNPYRARPTRSRVDHSAAYGMQNQNMWMPMSRPQSEVPANDTTQQQPVMNQSKHASNTWKDPWDWNLDQQSDTQQQPPQQPQQQQPYVPPYQNQGGQMISNSVQNHYYKSLNGNTSDVLDQNSGRNTPRSESTRPQSGPNYTDSLPPYANYNQNQQYPPRQNITKPGYEHAQWPSEQQSQNAAQQRLLSQQSSQMDQPPPASHNIYNWSKEDTSNLPSQHNWQNHTDMLGNWQDQNIPQEMQQHVDSMDNQVTQPPPMYNAPPVEGINKEHSTNWSNGQQGINEMSNKSNTVSNQWHNQNCEAAMSHHQSAHLVQTSNVDDIFSSWSQSGNVTTASHDWRYSNVQSESVHPNQWLQQQQQIDNSFKENVPQDNNGARFAVNEWQQVQTAPFNYAPAATTVPTTIESIVHTPNNNEQQENEKQATLASSYEPLVKSSDIKSLIGDHNLNVVTDDAPKSDISKSVLGENDDRAFVPSATEELSSNFGQLNLGNKPGRHADYSGESLEVYPSSVEGKAQHSAVNFSVAGIRSNPIPDNISVLSPDYAPSMDNADPVDNQPAAVSQDHPVPNTYQSATKVTDSISQSGYDQWYNQNTLENAHWNYTKDHHSRPAAKQWSTTPEQNVENYENIQQTSDFVNVEVVAPTTLQERDIYGSRDSINKETLDNDPRPRASSKEGATNVRGFREEMNNVEVLSIQQQQQQIRPHPPLQTEQMPDNYEFASNDRNTFLETGELTDSHQEHEPTPPSQDDENDEVPNDIPFLREVPGQSSTMDPRRNDPTGQEHHVQTTGQRLSDPRRNDPSGQEQSIQIRNISDRIERRDVLPGQERNVSQLLRGDSDALERRNDPSGRERSVPPQQSRNDPSGEERYQPQSQMMLEPSETREVLGRGNEPEEVPRQIQDATELRQIPGGASSNDVTQLMPDGTTTATTATTTGGRVVTGSLLEMLPPTMPQDPTSGDTRSKREEAVGASLESETSQGVSSSSNRRDSYEDVEEDEDSRESRDESRERRREASPDRRRYVDHDRKNAYYDHDREYEDDYYYDRRRVGDNDRQYNMGPREDFKRRDVPYRDDDRKHHSRDDLDRYAREDMDRRVRGKEDLDERDGRRRPQDDRRREDPRRRDRDPRDYDPRYSRDPRDPRDKDYMDRERRRPRRYDDYDTRDPYRRDYYSIDDLYGRSSRPSSRSSYNDKDREYYARTKDPYYGYNVNARFGGYDYGALYGNKYYAYLENLRQTNPTAYAEWYHKWYSHQQQQQHIARGVGNYPEDRASVHSGRSSCDDRTGDKRTLGDTSVLEDSTIVSARLTPTKFSTSHAYGCFSIGSLVHVQPSYPADGERAKVDIFRVDSLLSHDPVTRDLRLYPGPLINGVTHKKTIIEYCENKIKKAVVNEEIIDRASYILLYELMIMLIQQNGNVVGVDIAALLLRNKDAYPHDTSKLRPQDVKRRESQVSQRSGATGSDGSTQDISALSEKSETKQRKTMEQITDEFRDTLLYGRVQEALEFAMNEGLWGHALFLASKLDKRTHASVMTRFANSLPPHDPLQTLYQLHSGRVPAIVTCVADPRWDDWRPHLAMIISNTSANPEINRRSITTLGDTLFAKGDIHAAHLCYILAQIDFGSYGVNGVKLVLIGANHNKPYSEFLTMEAVMLTEIYEYARNLSDPCFTLVDLQTFKFDLIVKMVDCGLIEKALLYIEQIAINIANDPSKYKKSFIKSVYVLGDQIKYHDPIYKDAIEDVTNLTWLNKLAEIVGKFQGEEISEGETYVNGSHTVAENQEIHEMKQQQSLPPSTSQQQWNIQPEYGDGPVSMMEVNTSEMQSNWQPLSLPTNIQDTYDPNAQYMRNVDESAQHQQLQQQQDYWNQQSYYQGNYGRNESTLSNWQQQSIPGIADQTEINNTQQLDKWNYESSVQPIISMGPSTGKQYDPLEELDALETSRTNAKPSTEMKKTSEKTTEKKPGNSGSSWFGGLFSKLAPKPKNQMILPDDSNPTIVWDPVAKKWMNKDADGDGGAAALVPPPKTSDISFRGTPMIENRGVPSQPLPPSGEDAPTMDAVPKLPINNSNMFKLQKGRSMRANYVDVMNPGGGKPKTATASSTPMTSPLVPMATSSPQLFIPTPINDSTAPVDFLIPAATPPSGNVAENTPQAGPMMFNPNDMKDRSVKNIPSSRYPPR